MNIFRKLRNHKMLCIVFFSVFMWGCAYQPGSFQDPGGLNFISFSHKEEDIQQTLDVCREALEIIKTALEKGDVAARLRTRDITKREA